MKTIDWLIRNFGIRSFDDAFVFTMYFLFVSAILIGALIGLIYLTLFAPLFILTVIMIFGVIFGLAKLLHMRVKRLRNE